MKKRHSDLILWSPWRGIAGRLKHSSVSAVQLTCTLVDQYNRHLHTDEIKFLQDKDRIRRFASQHINRDPARAQEITEDKDIGRQNTDGINI